MNEVLQHIDGLMKQVPKTKYPLTCGCAGARYLSMCPTHQLLEIEKSARLMGVRSLSTPHCATCNCSTTTETIR